MQGLNRQHFAVGHERVAALRRQSGCLHPLEGVCIKGSKEVLASVKSVLNNGLAPTTKLSLIGNDCCPVVRLVSSVSSGRRYGRQLREGCSVLSRLFLDQPLIFPRRESKFATGNHRQFVHISKHQKPNPSNSYIHKVF